MTRRPAPRSPPPPDLGPRYVYRGELGRGGSGRVILARDSFAERDVAIKLLDDTGRSARDLDELRHEFRVLSSLRHPGIARAHDFGFIDGRPYFSAEHVEGTTLEAWLETRTGGMPALLAVLGELIEVVAFVRRAGVVHLDLKPSNVVLQPGDDGWAPKLIDFGLCRRAVDPDRPAPLRGTLPYVAPECVDGGPIGPWTDVYALGVLFYRAVCDRFPRRGASAPEAGSGTEPWLPAPPPPSRWYADVPREWEYAILRCLALEPDRRFRDADELARALGKRVGEATRRRGARRATIGREEPLGLIEREVSRLVSATRGASTEASRAGALVVTALPGCGLTHFLEDVKLIAETRGVRAFLERGYPGSRAEPGSALRSVGLAVSSGAGGASRAWGEFLRQLADPRQTTGDETTERERRARRALRATDLLAAITEPYALIIDGLEWWDEVSVALVVDVARWLRSTGEKPRPPILLVVGLRELGPHAALLREFVRETWSTRGETISIGPLDVDGTWQLHRHLSAPVPADPSTDETEAPVDASGASPFSVFQTTGGVPAAIVRDARGGDASPSSRRPSADNASESDRAVLATLLAFDRPATGAELASALRVPADATLASLESLESARLARRVSLSEAGWIPSSGLRLDDLEPSASERAQRHEAIGAVLLAGGRATGPRLVEAFHHFHRAGRSNLVSEHGPGVVRYLRATRQTRAALDAIRKIRETVAERSPGLEREIALESAELHGRLGELDEAAHLLRGVLASEPRPTGDERRSVLLRLATVHAKRGDLRTSEALFAEALGPWTVPPPRPPAGDEPALSVELLAGLDEYAALLTILGRHDDALALCALGLERASQGDDPESRQARVDLIATRGNVHARRFEPREAISSYQEALEIAESAGSEVNRAVILNNLALVKMQIEENGEALDLLRTAERTCERFDDGPSLVSIHANAASLAARLGDREGAQRSLDRLHDLDPDRIGKRQELFHHHARGLVSLYDGRYLEAADELNRAVEVARVMGDAHLERFDGIHLAECLAHSGRIDDAEHVLRVTLETSEPDSRAHRMAATRLAWARSLASRPATSPAGDLDIEAPEGTFLDAVDRLYAGAARAGSTTEGTRAEGDALLAAAEAYFERYGYRPLRALAAVLHSRGALSRGDDALARRCLDRVNGDESVLSRVAVPILGARLALRGGDRTELRRAADALAHVGSWLALHPLPPWEAEWREVHRAIELASASGPMPASSVGEATRPLRPAEPLVVRSDGMRRVDEEIDRCANSELPVVIIGEAGTGKELVARELHARSARSACPFRVVDFRSIPSAVFDAELFGALAGSFTDATIDRPGLLAGAKGGTLLLDGLTDLDAESQAKLLRVLAEGRLRPLGSTDEIRLDARFVVATTEPLADAVRRGALRADLRHRLDVLSIAVPPLRERAEDVPDLVRSFLDSSDAGTRLDLDESAWMWLQRRPWRGNARELRGLVLRLAVVHDGPVTARDLAALGDSSHTRSLFPTSALEGRAIDDLIESLEREYFRHHIRETRGDLVRLGERVGLSRRQIYRRLEKLGISLRAERTRLRDDADT